jgi:ribosomal protein L11 methyltransferase
MEDLAVAAFWESGCLGVQTRAAARQTVRPRVFLEAWYPGRTSVDVLARRLRKSLRAAGVPSSVRPRLRRQRERSWVRAWRANLKPIPTGRRILVLPESVAAPPRTRRLVIRVPIGQAFGTGEHATTRLCLRLLEAWLRPGDRIVDLGTGTGILAAAALRLGAGRVLAVDSDPIAVRVARDMLRRNRLGRALRLQRCDAGEALRRGPFDLVLANIGARSSHRLLPGLAGALAPGGHAVIAGHLMEDEAELLSVARRAGLRPAERLRARPWSALLLRRPRR